MFFFRRCCGVSVITLTNIWNYKGGLTMKKEIEDFFTAFNRNHRCEKNGRTCKTERKPQGKVGLFIRQKTTKETSDSTRG